MSDEPIRVFINGINYEIILETIDNRLTIKIIINENTYSYENTYEILLNYGFFSFDDNVNQIKEKLHKIFIKKQFSFDYLNMKLSLNIRGIPGMVFQFKKERENDEQNNDNFYPDTIESMPREREFEKNISEMEKEVNNKRQSTIRIIESNTNITNNTLKNILSPKSYHCPKCKQFPKIFFIDDNYMYKICCGQCKKFAIEAFIQEIEKNNIDNKINQNFNCPICSSENDKCETCNKIKRINELKSEIVEVKKEDYRVAVKNNVEYLKADNNYETFNNPYDKEDDRDFHKEVINNEELPSLKNFIILINIILSNNYLMNTENRNNR